MLSKIDLRTAHGKWPIAADCGHNLAKRIIQTFNVKKGKVIFILIAWLRKILQQKLNRHYTCALEHIHGYTHTKT